MKRPNKPKAARREPAAFGEYQNTRTNLSPARRLPQRSAFNWLLDSATYIHDGDQERARMAAMRGLRAITRRRRSC